MIGTTLSHFKITAKLGEGGMGEVYRAEDTKLGREVAIKVLPEAVASDPERLARFEREAKVLAALNHTNIAGIYSLESSVVGAPLAGAREGTTPREGTSPSPTDTAVHFLVMELAEGEDLAQRLQRGPVPLEQALPIALQIAEALEVAHERGIIHRDLKPANIKVTPDGQVKVLDFGLAKALDPHDPTTSGPHDLSLSPTLTAQMTSAGIILGTAAYMSPEQARGQEAERRSDIWSFGLVLYEMLSGQRLFQADTVSDTLARVLMQEPDWAELEGDLPAPILRLLQRCMERDTRMRLQAIGEARIALEGYIAEPESAEAETAESQPTSAAPRSSLLRQAAPWLVVGGALGALAAFWIGRQPGPEASTEPLHFAIHPVEGNIVGSEDTNGLDISRDGRKITFVGTEASGSGTMLYLKTIADAEPRAIPGTEGARAPFFSPDGEWIGYFTDRELRKVSLLGGSPIPLVSTGDRRGGLWHPDGTIYFVPHSAGPIMKISAVGGELTPVTSLDSERHERTHRWPSLVPGGKAILFTSDTHESTEYYDDARIEAVDLDTGERKVVLEGTSRAVATSSGHLIFARDGSLFQVPFDLDKLETTGSPQMALQGVLTVVVSGAVQFAISDTGAIAYVPGGKTTEIFDLIWLTPEGESETASSERGVYYQAALSPQGDRAALTNSTADAQDLWILDMERGSKSRLTFEAGNSDPIWTADGKRIVYSSNRDGSHIKPYIKSADGIGEPELLWDSPDEAFPMDLSHDGRWLAVEHNRFQSEQEQGTEIWLVDLTGERKPYPFFEDRFTSRYASFSPDDRWLAYVSSESGEDHIYVRPFPSADGKWQISQVTAREPRWSPDGTRLFYRTTEGLKYVTVDTTEGFRASRPVLVEPGGIGAPFNMTYSFGPDGERLLVLRPHAEDQSQWRVHVILGWQDQLGRR